MPVTIFEGFAVHGVGGTGGVASGGGQPAGVERGEREKPGGTAGAHTKRPRNGVAVDSLTD